MLIVERLKPTYCLSIARVYGSIYLDSPKNTIAASTFMYQPFIVYGWVCDDCLSIQMRLAARHSVWDSFCLPSVCIALCLYTYFLIGESNLLIALHYAPSQWLHRIRIHALTNHENRYSTLPCTSESFCYRLLLHSVSQEDIWCIKIHPRPMIIHLRAHARFAHTCSALIFLSMIVPMFCELISGCGKSGAHNA